MKHLDWLLQPTQEVALRHPEIPAERAVSCSMRTQGLG